MEQLLQYVISGLAIGCIYAIASSGLVLTYTTTGVFNFAHGAVGGLCAFIYWWLVVSIGLPQPVSFVLVIGVVAPLLGLVLEAVVFRHFRAAPIETTLVVSIALTLFFLGLTNQLFDSRTGRQLPNLFSFHDLTVGKLRVSADEIFALIVAIGVALGLRALLYGTRLGTAMRAVVDSPELLVLTGAPRSRVAKLSWVLGAQLAGLSGVLVAAGKPLVSLTLAFLVLNSYAAAMVGRLRSLALTFAGALALGVLVDLTNVTYLWGSGDVWNRLRLAIPAIFLFVAMLLLPQSRLRSARPAGRHQARAPSLVATLRSAAIFLLVVLVASRWVPAARVLDINKALVAAIVILSLVLLTGYGGQISLATYVFMAIGAATSASIAGGGSPLGLLAAAAVAAPVGAIVALPALRLQGLYLALGTFAFALAGQQLIVGDPHLFGRGSKHLSLPRLGPLSIHSGRSFMIFLAVVFAVIAVGLLAVRRGSIGRRLVALRDSEVACATLGFDVRRAKVAVFSVAAALAGLGGALFAQYNVVVADVNFDPINNLVLFLFAVVGGVTTITGAALGGGLFALLAAVQGRNPGLGGLVFAAIGAVAVSLGKQPNGLAGLLSNAWRRRRVARPPASPVAATVRGMEAA